MSQYKINLRLLKKVQAIIDSSFEDGHRSNKEAAEKAITAVFDFYEQWFSMLPPLTDVVAIYDYIEDECRMGNNIILQPSTLDALILDKAAKDGKIDQLEIRLEELLT